MNQSIEEEVSGRDFSSDRGPAGAFKDAALVLIVTALVGALPLYCLWERGVELVFHHLSGDTYYYLEVAQQSHAGFYTYDGTVAINNFHPLWQYALTFVFSLIEPANQSLQLKTVFVVCVTLVAAGYGMTALAVRRLTGSALLGILLIPGFYDLALGRIAYYPTAPWRFINGMESGCSILFAGFFLLFLSGRAERAATGLRGVDAAPIIESARSLLVTGVFIGVLALCRLDDGLLLVTFCAAALMSASEWRAGVQRALILGFGASCLILPYFIFNKHSAGVWLPLSGVLKTGFSLFANLEFVFLTLLPGYLLGAPLDGRLDFPIANWKISIWRTSQMIFPVLAALLFLAVRAGRRHWREFFSEPTLWIDCILVYVILKGMYHLSATYTILQGEWYYAVSILSVNFIALTLIANPFTALIRSNPAVRALVGSLAMFVLLGVGAHYAHFAEHSDKWLKYYRFWSDRNHIQTVLKEKDRDIRIAELDDGIIGYSLGIPTINAMNAISLTAYRAREQGEFFDYCLSRNFNTIASLSYNPLPRGVQRPEQIASIMKDHWSFVGQGADRFRFELVYRHPPSGAVFIRFTPIEGREAAAGPRRPPPFE